MHDPYYHGNASVRVIAPGVTGEDLAAEKGRKINRGRRRFMIGRFSRGRPRVPLPDAEGWRALAGKRYLVGEGCWVWLGCLSHSRTCPVKFSGTIYEAHRLAYQLLRGPIPKGHEVLHVCGNPRCVNPDHMRCAKRGSNTNAHNAVQGRHCA